jgi:hypothetical protein
MCWNDGAPGGGNPEFWGGNCAGWSGCAGGPVYAYPVGVVDLTFDATPGRIIYPTIISFKVLPGIFRYIYIIKFL